MNNKLTDQKIQELALKHKFKLTKPEIDLIHKQFNVIVFPNIARFRKTYKKYQHLLPKSDVVLNTNAFFRSDEINTNHNRQDFLVNLKNKTPEGYVYVLNKPKSTKVTI